MQGITFAGAGALGQGLGALLGSSNATTMLVRATTRDSLLHAGALRIGGLRPIELPVQQGPGAVGAIGLVIDPSEIPADDAVIFATKAPQLAQIAAEVSRRWRRRTGWVAGMQNGVVKDDLLFDAFGSDAVVGCATMTAAGRDADGSIEITGVGTTYFGEFDGQPSQRVAQIADAFRRAELPIETTDRIRSLLWTKCANTVGVFATSSLTRLDTWTLLGNANSVATFLDLVAEAAALAEAEGEAVSDFPGLTLRTYLNCPRNEVISGFVARARAAGPVSTLSYTSMVRDITAGRSTEVEFVFGDLVRRAAQHKVDVPRIRLVYQLISAMGPATS